MACMRQLARIALMMRRLEPDWGCGMGEAGMIAYQFQRSRDLQI
jgi:hypothetical protein